MSTVETFINGLADLSDFGLNKFLGSRSAIRLVNSTCFWIKETTGRTQFNPFSTVIINTSALVANVLKPLDESIYTVSGIKGAISLMTKSCDRKSIMKTASDSFAGLRYLSKCGLVILSPYAKQLGIGKNAFAVGVACLDIIQESSTLWSVASKSLFGRVSSDNEKAVDWRKSALMLTVAVCSFSLNFFGALEAIFGDSMNPKDRMPAAAFVLWGTCASVAVIANDIIDYYASKTN